MERISSNDICVWGSVLTIGNRILSPQGKGMLKIPNNNNLLQISSYQKLKKRVIAKHLALLHVKRKATVISRLGACIFFILVWIIMHVNLNIFPYSIHNSLILDIQNKTELIDGNDCIQNQCKIPGYQTNWASSTCLEQQNWLLWNILLDLGTVFLVKINLGLETRRLC